ncbi:hypothetical protein ACJX0J_033142, partial [Zea mays]
GVAGGVLFRGGVPCLAASAGGGGGGAPVRGGGAAGARRPGARRGGGRRPRGAPPHQGVREAPAQARRGRRPARRHAPLPRARGWGGRAARAAQPRRQGREPVPLKVKLDTYGDVYQNFCLYLPPSPLFYHNQNKA